MDHQHLVHQYSNTPAIYFIIIVVSMSNLRRDIIESPTQGFTLTVSLDRPSKISDFQVVSQTNNIFWFEITMHNSMAMQVLNPTHNLCQIFCCFGLCEWTSLQDFLVKVMAAILHNEVGFISANMIAIGRQDVRMIAIEVNFHLFDHKLELNFLFLERFDNNNQVIHIRRGQDNNSCLTLAKLFDHLELILRLSGPKIGHLFESLIHIVQFIIHISLLLKVPRVQFFRQFIRLQLLLDIVNISAGVAIHLHGLFDAFQIDFAIQWGIQSIFWTFGVPLRLYSF